MVGGGALQVGDICLVEDIGKRSGALGSDLIANEPLRARSRMKMVSECVKSGGGVAYSSVEIIVSLRMAASAEAPSSPIALHPRLQRI